MEYVVGIDLGTTFSAAAVSGDGRVEIFSLGNRAATIPSIVYLRGDGEVLIGEAAERRAAAEPWRAAREFKRRLGDPTPIILGGTPHSTESLLALVYQAIVDVVAERRGARPAAVVVTHPAYYGSYKLDLLSEAVRMAGVTNAEFIPEPVAAAAHYAGQERVDLGQLIAVYDFGGGTFDAAVLKKTEDSFEVVGTPEGLAHLGGIDFDEAVFAYVRRQLAGTLEHLDESDPAVLAALVRLRSECTAAKEALSVDTETTIPVLLPGSQTMVSLTRETFEGTIRPRLGETIGALGRALASAGLTMDDLDRILLVGGSSRIPLVRRTVEEATRRPVTTDAEPKFSVALGAALAGLRNRNAAAGSPNGTAQGRARQTLPVASGAASTPPVESAPLGPPGGPPRQPVASAPPPAPEPGPSSPPSGQDGAGAPGRARLRARLWIALVAGIVVIGLISAVVIANSGDAKKEVARSVDTTVPTTVARPPVTIPPGIQWRRVHDAPTARQQVAAVSAAGALWVFGGLTDSAATAKVEGYDPAIDTWKVGPDLPTPLHHQMAVNYKDELVVVGGWTPVGSNLTAVTSDRVFALRRGAWVELPRLNRPRAAGAAVVVGDKIVVTGGQGDGVLLSTTEVYDGTAWREVAPIPTPRDHLGAVSDGKWVYAVGGRALSADKNTGALERYDPATDTWEKLPDMPTPRGGLGAAMAGRLIVTVGGEGATDVFDTVEAFDVDAGAWITLPPMGSARHGLATLGVGSSVYAIAGATRPTHARSTAVVEVLDLSAPGTPVRQWRRVHDAPTARQQVAAVSAAGALWVFGGLTDSAATAKVEGYDPAIDTWKVGPDLPTPLHHQMAVNYKDELVVVGGWTPVGSNLTAVTSDRVFALRRGAWVELPRLNRPRAAGAAVVVGDKIVVTGGQGDGVLLSTTEVYDGTAWREVAPIPTPRDHLGAVSDGKWVYAVGGRALSADKNTGALERYDPATDTWEKLPDMPTPRGGLGAAMAGRLIVTVGGEGATDVFDTVEAFDVDAGAWITLPPMGSARHGLATLGVGSSVYAIAGATRPTHARSTAVVEVLDLGVR